MVAPAVNRLIALALVAAKLAHLQAFVPLRGGQGREGAEHSGEVQLRLAAAQVGPPALLAAPLVLLLAPEH